MMRYTIVTIMPGPGPMCRVRELPEGCCKAITVKWCGCSDDAVEYVRKNYTVGQLVRPDEFRNEVKRRK